MLNKKFVFAVSLVAMMAVSSVWATDPASTSSTTDTVETAHSVFTEYTPTEAGSKAGIAGVTYVNRAVNSAGNAAIAAENHAAASGAYAIDAETAAKLANTAAAAAQAAATAAQALASEGVDKANAAQETADSKVSIAQGTKNAGKGLVVDATSGNLTLTDVATQAELDAVSGVANAAQTASQVSSAISTAIGNLDGNAETTGTNDGKYVTAVTQADGKITPSVVAFDTSMSSTSTNAVQNKVVNTALGTKENVSNKVTGDTYTSGDATKYPSIKTAEAIANTAVAATKSGLESLTARVAANEGVIDTLGTLAYKDTVTSALITDGAVTSAKIADKTIVNADVADNAAIAASKIAGLATVATSGSYSDLSGKPAINNATLTIKKNGTSVGTFTANASANNEINITVPTTVASLTDAGSYATVAAMNAADANKVNVAQGSSAVNKAVITDASGDVTTGTIATGMITDGAVTGAKIGSGAVTSAKIADKTIVNADVADNAAIAASKISGLATVATSGSYSDLSGKPAINNATLTIKKNGTSVGTFTANASANNEINITVPTTVASLTDAGSYATVAAMDAADAKKVSIAQGTTNAGKGLVVDATSGNLTLTDVATQAELNAVSSVANAAQTAGQVSSAISTAIGNLDGNAETTGTNDGKYVTAVTQADGKITPSVVAFDTSMSSSSTNAVQNRVVNTALGTKENVSNKVTTDTYTSGDATKYPSIKTAEAIANTAVAATKSGLESLTARVAANEGDIETLQTGKQDKLTAGTNISISADNTISSTYTYTLPTATASVKGGVTIGSNIGVNSGKISVADATATTKGVSVLGVIPSGGTGSAATGTATIWVE